MKTDQFAGKVALVTGGSKGIGAAIAERLGHGGARVAVTFIDSADDADAVAQEIERDGSTALTIRANSGSPDDLTKAIGQAIAAFGHVDFLINNAGANIGGRLDQIGLDEFETMVAINLRGVFIAIKEVLPHMPSGGRVINIGSISAEYMPMAGNSLYAMTKAGIQGLTKGLVRELAERTITINNVEPGRIDTGLLHHVLGDKFDAARAATPLGRFGTADEVAALVEYLCSESAGYITGADLRVDGGVSVG